MYVGLKQPRGDGERYVTPARAAAKETTHGDMALDTELTTAKKYLQGTTPKRKSLKKASLSNLSYQS